VATIIKKPVLRFDGANDFMGGLLNQTIDGGYMFAAFSVLGDGGEDTSRIFSVNNTGGTDGDSQSAIFSLRNNSVPDDLFSYQAQWISGHSQMFDDDNGDILHESLIKNGTQKSLVNNAGVTNHSNATTISAEEFNIVSNATGLNNSAIDLEYLALFPASITDAQADAVRNYINKRNNVFYRWDTDGYYFFDPQKANEGKVTSWNGRIVGSDNGDTDKLATQTDANDQPVVGDGYVVTFADNSDHLDIPSTTQAGWQVVGTSLGTFAYRVNSNAVTELNLLGNMGNTSYRQAGDLYGVILLPESATGKDIQEARKLLIDRGAADASTFTSAGAAWFNRKDIVEFRNTNFPILESGSWAMEGCSNMTTINTINAPNCYSFYGFWSDCQALQSFPADSKLGTERSEVNFTYAWRRNYALTSFPALDLSTGIYFTSAWEGCSALTSFPAGAKLGTEVNYVDFNNAWRDSGLTSFPALDLSNGDNFTNAWRGTNYLTEIASGLQLGNNPAYTGVSFTRAWQDSGLTSFPALDLSRGTAFDNAWLNCSALTSFPSDALLGTEVNSVNFTSAWQNSGLTSFSTPLPTATTLTQSFQACSSLTQFTSNLSSALTLVRTWRNSGLTSFSVELPSARFISQAWEGCSDLVDFSAEVFDNWNPSSITSEVFNLTWSGCTSLTAQSVENILTSIDASGKYATSTGLSGGTALTDAGIDIDYDGSGLTAATTAAITSLKSKGWSIFINSVEQ
jgi:hypothetical protein